jgi:DNA-binding XRE family transcriptional regulator
MLEDLIKRIRAHLRKPGVTKKAFAQAAGVHANSLSGIEHDTWNPTLHTLKAYEAQLPATSGFGPVGATVTGCDVNTGKFSEISGGCVAGSSSRGAGA